LLNNLTAKNQKFQKKKDDERYSFDGDYSGFIKKKSQKDTFKPIVPVPSLQKAVSNLQKTANPLGQQRTTIDTGNVTTSNTDTKPSSIVSSVGKQIKNNITNSLKKKIRRA